MNNILEQIKGYKEVYIFLFILIIWLICIIIFRLDLILNLQNLITISAVIVALVTAILTLIYNKRFLKQSQINLQIQLLHEDRKKALFKILTIVDDESSDFFEIETFIKSPESIYLPDNTQILINNAVKKVNDAFPFIEDEIKTAREIIKENVINNINNPNNE